MSAIKFELEAELRQDVGKGASRRLRHANSVPAIIYGANQEPVALTLDHNKVITALSHEAFYSHILTLKVNGENQQVVLKDVQRNPAAPQVMHIDFLRVRADQKLHMHIPLHFIGGEKAPGAKDGGVFSHLMTDVEVSCLPANLPEFIEVDISGMALDTTLHLSDLKLPKGIELTALSHGVEGHDLPVVTIHKPRMIEEEVPVAEATEEAEEGAAPKAAEGEEGEEAAK